MKLYKYIVIVLFLMALGSAAVGNNNVLLSDYQSDSQQQTPTDTITDTTQTSVVDMIADVITKKSSQDSTIYLVGNVAFHHNGAIIECDSAARYDDMKMDGFGKVTIYKDSAYIYGDKFSYDGNTNIATVYAPIVKMKRADVVMYTYNLKFNTKTNVAEFVNGGMMLQKDNVMEAVNGVFNADNKTLTFKDSVAMRSDDMLIKTDSLTYNMDNEIITFLTQTVIWDTTTNILVADRGNYITKDKTYNFTENGYIMTADQEMWADTMTYFSTMREATMTNNVQVDDSVNNTVALSDWAYYNDSLGKAILSRKPSLRMLDTANHDTTYMRADTIHMSEYIHHSKLAVKVDTSAIFRSMSSIIDTSMHDSLKFVAHRILTVVDSLEANQRKIDSLYRAELLNDTLPKIIDSMYIVDMTIDTTVNGLWDSQGNFLVEQKDTVKEDTVVVISPKELMLIAIDSIVKHDLKLDSAHYVNAMKKFDSIKGVVFKKAALDSVEVMSEQKLMRAFWGVKMWSKMYQTVSDSLVGYSVDSTTIMYGNPVLWNEQNQLSAEQINIYAKDEVLDWVECIGAPFMAQKMVAPKPVPADSSRYNQAIGKQMYAYFNKGEMDSVVIDGNVMNNYYMENEGYTSGFAHITCGEMVIFFKDRTISNIRWESSPEWSIFPIEKIDPKVPEHLEGFNWQDSIRPKSSWEISPRNLRSTMREQVRAKRKPLWNVEIKLIDFREKLLMDELWIDREDEIKNTPLTFITIREELVNAR